MSGCGCGHLGCNGQECKDDFVLTLPGGSLDHDCAICCREILDGEPWYRDELVEVAGAFRVLTALTASG